VGTNYSLVIPTYHRPDMLRQCLDQVACLDYPSDQFEVLVIDNGGLERNSADVGLAFQDRLSLRYLVNEVNRGMGFSLNRGMRESRGKRIVLLNDDAMIPPSFLVDLDATFASDQGIGCVGCRADEKAYARQGTGIGRIDPSGEVVGNFDQDCGRTIEVEHVYGFCYAFTREALHRAGVYDEILLARPYSSANRTETDHCLSIRRAGFKVVYNPAIVVEHLAKPRADMSEVSLKWKLNHTRNTLYLFLKHYGLLGKKCLALRFTFVQDVGILSACRRPTWYNLRYFLTGLRGRLSAYSHYLLYLCSTRSSGRAFANKSYANSTARKPVNNLTCGLHPEQRAER
jgi:GT2 family glycosyltransferase